MCLYNVVQLARVLVQRLLTEIHATISTGMNLAFVPSAPPAVLQELVFHATDRHTHKQRFGAALTK